MAPLVPTGRRGRRPLQFVILNFFICDKITDTARRLPTQNNVKWKYNGRMIMYNVVR